MKYLGRIILFFIAFIAAACTKDFNEIAQYGVYYEVSKGLVGSFNDFCLKNFDFNGDGNLSKSEVEKVTVLDCTSQGFTDLDLIVLFTNLDTLRCAHNRLKELDLSKNNKLRFLDCSYNYLEKLDVSTTEVSTLYCAPMDDDKGNNLLKYLFIYRGQSIQGVTYGKGAYKDKRIPDQTQVISVPSSKDGDTDTQ